MATEPLINIKDMSFVRDERVIYDDLNMKIMPGKVTAIMGPSGIGKTTLLRLIGGQLSPTSGDISYKGQSIPAMSRKALFNVRKNMGMLFQSGALFTDMSVFDNVAFPLRENTRLSEIMIRTLVLMKLQAVGLRGAAKLMPNELSGGMARRVALARAIALDPELVMYDEPFAGQDPISMGVLVRLIKGLSEALALTSIVVTHDVNEVMSIADYVYIIAEKRIVGEGSPEDIRANTSPLVQQFLRGVADGPVPFHYPSEPIHNELLES